ncbi:hypothetical protein M9H77_16193 [Catharanthus roseus]|uniref:Uncharacterized protein n=1 Tax=Catharanthus roseus TaxID=4058 RepID=A0ACC0AZM4_CATRO|nr:hypothetical protein M9H77_16193 [Catharanthus roseus]
MRNGRSGRIIYFECMHTLENAHAMDRKTEDIIQIKSIIMLYFWIEETSFQTKDFHWRTFYRSPQRMNRSSPIHYGALRMLLSIVTTAALWSKSKLVCMNSLQR